MSSAAKSSIDFNRQVVQRAGGGSDKAVRSLLWTSPFAVNTRLTPTINLGRVFLAGDASHVHSPVRGQGMNTGIQDAMNLAWKLALVVKGLGSETLLDSYNTERRANAKRLLGFVGSATSLADLRFPVETRVRRLALMAVGQMGLTSPAAQRISELDSGRARTLPVWDSPESGV